MMSKALPVAAAALLLAAPPALAVPVCPDAHPLRTLVSGQGTLESVIAANGVLYYTDVTKKALMRLDAPGAQPVQVAGDIDAPGGLLANPDGTLVVGYGDSVQQGALGGSAGLLTVDPRTGRTTTLASGLSMANGLARDPAGTIYASSDVSRNIDRIRGNQVEVGWAQVLSANGLAIDPTGRYLLANQTFQPANIVQIDLADPTRITDYATPGPEDIAAGLDGLTIDDRGRLFAAANGGGQIWRIDTDRTICALASGLGMPSAVGFGGGGAFPPQNLYAVTFSGDVVELPDARPAPAPVAISSARLRARVSPRTIRPRRTTRVTVTVSRVAGTQSRVEPGALVRISNRHAVTGYDGLARLRIKTHRPGTIQVRVSAAGLRPIKLRLRVRAAPAPRRPSRSG